MSDSPVCILNVDDYVPGRYARTKILRQAGFEVVEAGTGSETLKAISEYKPAIVLLDVNLPDMNGFEICRRIKDGPDAGAITVIHVSASSIQSTHLVDGLDAGADAYLVEPLDASVLVATVKAFLRARRAESALRKSNDELASFAYRAAHHLNEPLRTLTAHTQLLARNTKGQLNSDSQQSIQFIQEAAQRMGDLVNRLLRYAQVGQERPQPVEIDCNALVARLTANLAEVMKQSAAGITHDPLPVICARPEIEEVFQNLIGNAIKYGRAGEPPRVHISATREPKGWRFAVQDNGAGIPAGDRESIFHIFRRLHGTDVSGSGVGLAIAKKIVDENGGKIWVESSVGVGSTFYFTLPEASRPEAAKSIAPNIPQGKAREAGSQN